MVLTAPTSIVDSAGLDELSSAKVGYAAEKSWFGLVMKVNTLQVGLMKCERGEFLEMYTPN